MATEKNITMKQFNGTDYDTLYPKTLSSQVEGLSDNFFTKSQTLTSDIASLFVGANVSVPNDAFRYLGKYAEYWWSVYSDNSWDEYVISQTDITENILLGQNPTNINITIAKSISIDGVTGIISLIDTESYNFIVNTESNNNKTTASYIASKAPCYIKMPDSDSIYYIPAQSTISGLTTSTATILYGTGGSYNGGYVLLNRSGSPKSQIVTSKLINHASGTTSYLQSTNRNAYPDSGTVDNITYNFLGIPFEKLPTGARIQTGSYVGTGTYGADNPCSLTFDFEPRFVIITNYRNYGIFISSNFKDMGVFGSIKYVSSSMIKFESLISNLSENNLLFYSKTNENEQLNTLNLDYYWICFGI